MDKKILIATHSNFAEGIYNSVKLLIGNNSDISIINAYIDDTDYTGDINRFFENFDVNKQYFVFSDIYGGSVNQKLVKYKEEYDFVLITGFNLPILLEILLQSEYLSEEKIDTLITQARQELKQINSVEIDELSDDDFL